MKNIIFTDTTQRKQQQNIDFNHLEVICQIQEGTMDQNAEECLKEIKKKHSSYKSQDKLKNKYDKLQHITLSQLIHKLIECKLKCYYCNKDLVILYNKKKEQHQWTLERLNNNIGHYNDNTCIACLKCNLGRRTDNHEYYKKGKTMILEKVI
jgi:hypothetical protein